MKKNIDNDETLIKSISTEHTGGHIYNDVIVLKDGTIIRISEGVVGVYKNQENDQAGESISITYY